MATTSRKCCSSSKDIKCCDNKNLCLADDEISVGFKSARGDELCVTSSTAISPTERMRSFGRVSSPDVSRYENRANTSASLPKEGSCSHGEPIRIFCKVNKCCKKVSRGVEGIDGPCCKKVEGNVDADFGDEESEAELGVVAEPSGSCCQDGDAKTASRDCCGVTEEKRDCSEVDSKFEKNELCLNSCAGKQRDVVKVADCDSTGAANGLESCCPTPTQSTCCSDANKTACETKEKFVVSSITDAKNCCFVKGSCADSKETEVCGEVVNASSPNDDASSCCGDKAVVTCDQGSTVSPSRCESQQKDDGQCGCCNESSHLSCCDKCRFLSGEGGEKSELIRTPKKKLLSKMGGVMSYGSTDGGSNDGEGRGHKYTALSSSHDAQVQDENRGEGPVNRPAIKSTKFRIQNICCGKEAELMKRELEPRNGIINVSVNVVGRIGFVRHDSNVISAPDIVTILNKLHLGVSIMESGNHDDENTLKKEVIIRLGAKLAILLVLLVLFIVVIVGNVHSHPWLKWVAVVEIIIGTLPIIRKIIINWMKKIFIDINMLMLIAVVGTIALREWLEGATLVFVFAIAEVLQQYCGYKVQSAISGIIVKLPDKVVLADTGKSVSIEDVKIGSVIVVCAGEKIALDGKVVKGHASVDESSITGEAVPIEKAPDCQTYSGTIVQNGYLEIKTTSDAQTSTVSKVTQMVQEAQAKASHTEKLMNKFAKIYTPLVLITALLVFAIPAILAELKVGSYESQLHSWGIRALVVLLIACPCALVMSVPIPIVCGITAAARNGVLVKSGIDMETLAKIEAIAFDKTGTLTEGRFKVVEIREFRQDMEYNEILKLVAAIEVKSSHPVAAALVNHYSGCLTDKIANFGVNVGLPDVDDFKAIQGQGLQGFVSGHSVVVGNFKMLRQNSVKVSRDAERFFDLWSNRGQTVIFCAVDNDLSLMIGLADTPRSTAKMTIDILKELGISTVILTGDCSGAAAAVMKATGAENYIASMKPEHKLEWIRKRQRPSRKVLTRVAMVGDGVNDGPSLAAADVGIAIGACATALAIESAGVALISDSLTKIPELLLLSRFTRRVVVQNIGIALAIKVAVMIATMSGSIALWMAVLSDVLGLLLVIVNGLRPLFWKRDDMPGAGETEIVISDRGDENSEDGMALIEIKS